MENLARIDGMVESMLRDSRACGAALAIVAGDEVVFARGFGLRDRDANLPMRAETPYPIASTTKAINATLIGMLVDEGSVQWDVPIRTYGLSSS